MQSKEMVAAPSHSEELPLDTMARLAGLHPELVRRFVECGLIRETRREHTVLFFHASEVPRLRTIKRLREALGINLAGVEVVLRLLEKIRALQHENESLRLRL